MDINNKLNLTRRKALIGGTVGVATVTAWHKPMLDAVLLPAHAQTSIAEVAEAGFFGSASTSSNVMNSSPWDILLEPAYAGNAPDVGTVFTVVVARVGEPGGMYEVGVHTKRSGVEGQNDIYESIEVVYNGTLSLGEAGNLDVDQNPCSVKLRNFEVEVEADNGDSIDITFVGSGLMLNVPQAEGTLPDAMCVFAIADEYFDADSEGVSGSASNLTKPSFSPLDLFIEPANAGMDQELSAVLGISAERDGTNFIVTLSDERASLLRRGTISAFGGSSELSVIDNPCDEEFELVTAFIRSADAIEMEIVIDLGQFFGPTEFIVPAAAVQTLSIECRE